MNRNDFFALFARKCFHLFWNVFRLKSICEHFWFFIGNANLGTKALFHVLFLYFPPNCDVFCPNTFTESCRRTKSFVWQSNTVHTQINLFAIFITTTRDLLPVESSGNFISISNRLISIYDFVTNSLFAWLNYDHSRKKEIRWEFSRISYQRFAWLTWFHSGYPYCITRFWHLFKQSIREETHGTG